MLGLSDSFAYESQEQNSTWWYINYSFSFGAPFPPYFPIKVIVSDSTSMSSSCRWLSEMTKCAIIFTLRSPQLLLSPCWRSNVCHLAPFYSWNSKRILFLLFLRCGVLFPADPAPPSLCCSSVISLGICPTFHTQWRFLSVFHLPVKFFLK